MAHAAQLAVLFLLRNVPGASSTCPAREAVEAALLPSTAAVLRANREHVVVSTKGTTLRVELAGDPGAPFLERTLTTDAPCATRAAAAATLVEAMALELHGGPPRVELPETTPESRPTVMADEAAAPAHAPLGLELGVAILGSLSEASIAPVAGLTVDLPVRLAGLRLRAALFAEGQRSLPIGAGHASYQDSWLTIGPGYRLRWHRFSLEAGVSLTGALQELRGDGVTSAASTAALEAGASLDAAVGWSFGSLRTWAGFIALTWPANTRISVVSLAQSRTLPAWEGLLGAGVQFTAL